MNGGGYSVFDLEYVVISPFKTRSQICLWLWAFELKFLSMGRSYQPIGKFWGPFLRVRLQNLSYYSWSKAPFSIEGVYSRAYIKFRYLLRILLIQSRYFTLYVTYEIPCNRGTQRCDLRGFSSKILWVSYYCKSIIYILLARN